MRDEDKFPTMRFLTCRACGHTYTASLSGVNTCPQCQAPARIGEGSGSRITKSMVSGHLLLTVTGTLYKMQELEDLKSEIDAALKGELESVAFHFVGASYLDSGMLGQLVRTVQELSRRGKPTYMISKDDQVIESLQILDLDKILTIHPSLEGYRKDLK